MILEAASIHIQPGQAAAFETAFTQAALVISAADGYLSHQLQRSVDVPDHYLLLVQWRTVEDHMVGFRESARFVEWRRLLGPFFAAPEHDHFGQRVIGNSVDLIGKHGMRRRQHRNQADGKCHADRAWGGNRNERGMHERLEATMTKAIVSSQCSAVT